MDNLSSRKKLFWKKINLSGKKVPAELLEIVLEKGCQYLNLSNSKLLNHKTYELCKHGLRVSKPVNLRYLNLDGCKGKNFKFYSENLIKCHYGFMVMPHTFDTFVHLKFEN